MAPDPQDLCEKWTKLADEDITQEHIQNTLLLIKDDLWVVAASVDRLLDDASLQRTLLDAGLERTLPLQQRLAVGELAENDEGQSSGSLPNSRSEELTAHFHEQPADAQICYMRTVLLDRLDRLNTYVEACQNGEGDDEEDIDPQWEDDPWEEAADEDKERPESSKTLPIALHQFLVDDLLDTACLLASKQALAAVSILCKRFGPSLWSYRYTILGCIPEHVHPSLYRDLLPGFDTVQDMEQRPSYQPWRTDADWSEANTIQAALKASGSVDMDLLPTRPTRNVAAAQMQPFSASELASWYEERVEDILVSTGMVDVALALVQHGGSQGVPGVDELGEELSLLSRLVYDAPSADVEETDTEWTLRRWREMEPAAVVQAYLANSTEGNLVANIRKLVVPYLFVLEARAERAGHPDTSISSRLLHDYILSAPLDFVASIFEASKPTLPPAHRLISDDEAMARLALSRLYGSDSLTEWPTMSRIFECLPAWDNSEADEDLADEAYSTVNALGAYVTPTTARPRCTPQDLLLFFKPLPATSLSRALDILDVHLEAGEILSRWGVPAPLRWFLQSINDETQQRAWATRLARRAGGSDDQLNTVDDWEWLLEDMIKLSSTNDTGLRSAFGLLEQHEVLRIFLSGLLSTGRFHIAKRLLHPRHQSLSALSDAEIETICLTCSREYYDNASSGNYRFGDMKLAYDCLSVPAKSDAIIREQEFIEATSSITSYNVMTAPGLPISPLEIRLVKDRLSLISRVLSSNDNAYKYPEVILELVHKLGFRDDTTATVKALAMITDTALQAEDFTRAYESSGTMISTILELNSSPLATTNPAKVQEANEVCWVACFQLGRQIEFEDVEKKLALLGRALEFCPPEKMVDVLNAWRRLESEDTEERRERLGKRKGRTGPDNTRTKRQAVPTGTAASLAARFQHLHMPDLHMPSSPLVSTPDAAAIAHTFSRVAANFPFSVGGRPKSVASDDSGREKSRSVERPWPSRSEHPDVSAQASRVFQKGIGWLIGADEEES
ncbi:Sec39-domain-containing protein [Dentipellis sp. KUC8613]|nr:Sec39-domain-containing protein [Dentipellis sp. KUC8613]